MKHVAIVGGGLAGLTAAHRLRLQAPDLRITLWEASARLGGQVRTEHADGFIVEHGAEGFSPQATAVRQLCLELGQEPRLQAQTAKRTLVLRQGRLAPLPDGEAGRLLGLQVPAAQLGAGLLSLEGGLEELVRALAARLDGAADLETGREATRLRPAASGRWSLESSSGPALEVDAVVLALPGPQAAALLAPVIGPAPVLRSLPLVSSVTVSLAWPAEAVGHPLDATGFVVNDSEPGPGTDGLRACTFCSAKFEGRAPLDQRLIRAFFRPNQHDLGWPDAAWTEHAARALTPLLHLRAAPARAWVSRWPHALPRYSPRFRERIARLRGRLAGIGPIELAGAAVERAGVEGAVRSGWCAAARCLGAA